MRGNNIHIRILERDDITRSKEWLNDPVLSDVMGYLPVFTLDAQLQWFDQISKDKSRFIFAICDNETNEHIGNVGLGNIDYIHRHGMFNIFIVNKTKRSKGLGTEAARLLLDFAFNRLNLNKVHLRTSARFVEANLMYKKIGFVQEGVMREHYFTDGKYEDKIIYSILKSEYHGSK